MNASSSPAAILSSIRWDDDNPDESIWLMSFYKRSTAMAITAPRNKRVMVFGDKATGRPVASNQFAA